MRGAELQNEQGIVQGPTKGVERPVKESVYLEIVGTAYREGPEIGELGGGETPRKFNWLESVIGYRGLEKGNISLEKNKKDGLRSGRKYQNKRPDLPCLLPLRVSSTTGKTR